MVGSRLWLTRYWDQEALVARELLARSADVPSDLDLPKLGGRAAAAVPARRGPRPADGLCGLRAVPDQRARRRSRHRQDHDRVAAPGPAARAGPRLPDRSSRADRQGCCPAGRGGPLVHRDPAAGGPGGPGRAAGDDAAPAARLATRGTDEVQARRRQPAPVRGGGRRRGLDGVADVDGPAAGGAAAVDPAHPGGRPRPARVGRGRRGARRPGRPGDPGHPYACVRRDPARRCCRARQVDEQPGSPLHNGISALSVNRRFTAASEIHALATAIRDGHGETALELLRSGAESLEFVEVADDKAPTQDQLASLRQDVEAYGGALHAAATAGDQVAAITALELHRVLCAHRRGPRGVQHWSALTAGWIEAAHPSEARGDGHYAGEPLLVTANDYEIGLYNGDTGVVVAAPGGDLTAVFGRGGEPIPVSLSRLGAVRPLHAMTVHRSQGSEFRRVTVLLADADSPLATRETLYTAVTRAQEFVRVIGSAEALIASIARPVARATGLRERLHTAV